MENKATSVLFFCIVHLFSTAFTASSPILGTVDLEMYPDQLVLSNDLRWLAYTTIDGIYLHDRKDNESFTLYESDDFPQLTIALSSDNEHLVYGSPMGVSLYNLATKTITKLPFKNPSALAFSPDGKLMLIAIKNQFYIWDFSSKYVNALKTSLHGSEKLIDDICTLAMSNNNQVIAVGTKAGTIHQIAVDQSCTTAILYNSFTCPSRIVGFCFGPENIPFYCAGSIIRTWNSEIRVHNKHGGKHLSFTSMAYNPKTYELFATTHDGKVWYISDTECISYSFGVRSMTLNLFPSADGNHVALVKPAGDYEAHIEIYPLTQKAFAAAQNPPCFVLRPSELTVGSQRIYSKPKETIKKQRTS